MWLDSLRVCTYASRCTGWVREPSPRLVLPDTPLLNPGPCSLCAQRHAPLEMTAQVQVLGIDFGSPLPWGRPHHFGQQLQRPWVG